MKKKYEINLTEEISIYMIEDDDVTWYIKEGNFVEELTSDDLWELHNWLEAQLQT